MIICENRRPHLDRMLDFAPPPWVDTTGIGISDITLRDVEIDWNGHLSGRVDIAYAPSVDDDFVTVDWFTFAVEDGVRP